MIVGPRTGAGLPRSHPSSPRLRFSCPRKLTHRIAASSSKDGKGKDKEPGDQGKADFSAYWSLKIKEAFDKRRKFLEEVDRKGIPPSDFVQKIEEKETEEVINLVKAQAEQYELRQVKVKARQQLEAQAARDADKTPGKPVRMQAEDADIVVDEDIEKARASVRSAAVTGFATNMYRARELVRAVLMFPINFAKAMQQQWSALYSSQSYENFLMSEGERIWYWRNRTENERWFWEIAFWDRLAMPILCAIAYEFLVPNNFIWAVIVPITFIFIQSGELPSVRGVEFWLIAYFGFYVKCWPDIWPMLKALVFAA